MAGRSVRDNETTVEGQVVGCSESDNETTV